MRCWSTSVTPQRLTSKCVRLVSRFSTQLRNAGVAVWAEAAPGSASAAAMAVAAATAVRVLLIVQNIVGSSWRRVAVIATVPTARGCVNLNSSLMFCCVGPEDWCLREHPKTSGYG